MYHPLEIVIYPQLKEYTPDVALLFSIFYWLCDHKPAAPVDIVVWCCIKRTHADQLYRKLSTRALNQKKRPKRRLKPEISHCDLLWTETNVTSTLDQTPRLSEVFVHQLVRQLSEICFTNHCPSTGATRLSGFLFFSCPKQGGVKVQKSVRELAVDLLHIIPIQDQIEDQQLIQDSHSVVVVLSHIHPSELQAFYNVKPEAC